MGGLACVCSYTREHTRAHTKPHSLTLTHTHSLSSTHPFYCWDACWKLRQYLQKTDLDLDFQPLTDLFADRATQKVSFLQSYHIVSETSHGSLASHPHPPMH
jgi:hypothetical protein